MESIAFVLALTIVQELFNAKAKIQMLDSKFKTTHRELQLKVEENASLTQLCDELLTQLEALGNTSH